MEKKRSGHEKTLRGHGHTHRGLEHLNNKPKFTKLVGWKMPLSKHQSPEPLNTYGNILQKVPEVGSVGIHRELVLNLCSWTALRT